MDDTPSSLETQYVKDFLEKAGELMREINDFLNEQLQDPELRKEWEYIQPEMDVIRAMMEARIS